MSWDDLLRLAAEQHGYFTTAQAAAEGITRRALSWRTDRRQVERIERGLYRLSHWPAGPDDLLHALRVMAPFGTFSHETALSLLGLSDLVPSVTHFTIPESSRLSARPGIRLHRSRARAGTDRTYRDGLWVSTARRAILDCARIGSDSDQLIAAALEARDRALLTDDDLALLRAHPRLARAGL